MYSFLPILNYHPKLKQVTNIVLVGNIEEITNDVLATDTMVHLSLTSSGTFMSKPETKTNCTQEREKNLERRLIFPLTKLRRNQ